MLDRVALLLFQLWMAAYFVDNLTISGFGAWAFTLSSISILLSIFILSIDIVVIRDVARQKCTKGTFILTGMSIQLLGLLVASVFSFFLFSGQSQIVALSVKAILLANFFIICSKPSYWEYTAMVESKYKSIATIVTLLLLIPTTYSLVSGGELLYGVNIVYIYSLYYGLYFFVSWIIYIFFYQTDANFCLSAKKVKEYFRSGGMLILSTLSVMVFTQSDVLMLKLISGTDVAGEYSAATKISVSIFVIAGVIANTFYPKLLNLSEELQLEFLKVLMSILIVLSTLGSLLTMLLASLSLHWLYGSNATEVMSSILSIHIWCSVFVFVGALSSRYFYSKSYYRLEVGKAVIAALFNFGLNLILIPLYGAEGAAIASVAAYFMANHLTLKLFSKSKVIFDVQTQAFLSAIYPYRYVFILRRLKCFFQ
ncbi:oligosaccharide flippase family protein [Vibrio scophthalmi]|uniref:oligosaccharide flippase family protein n=1 Tax=Vibrio scophthalmi TaxID=45658 RepID=UPI003EBD4A44